ncbi:MAG: PHP domain-containing protein [Candidatus Methanomethyliaceae archaeon]|nr:PHP domain-containing protein [Candidatus Methanomethyliaceae archaeon]
MKLKIDFHVHTNASRDAISSIKEVIIYAKRMGLDGIAITDHDVMIDPIIAEKLSEESNLIIIPGMELSTEIGHLIFLEDDLIIIPHPLDSLSHGIGSENVKELRKLNPAIEVKNGSTLPIFNKMAERLAIKLGLNMIGGSDAHIDFMVGSAYTIVYTENKSLEAIIRAIKMGKSYAVGGFSHLYLKYIIKKSLIKLNRCFL